MNELNAHYGLLLGLNDSWEVVEVNVDPEGQQVEILLSHRGGKRPRLVKSCQVRQTRSPSVGPNDSWSMDFLSDQLAVLPKDLSKC
jgi:hypothetical protein